MMIFDDFMGRAIMAGLLIAVMTGPLGCFIVWRRMAYFGDTIAHSALLGVSMGLLLEVNMTVSVFAIAVLVSLSLLFLQGRTDLTSDALLGILSHSALALGLVALSFMSNNPVDLMGYLFGDILAVSRSTLIYLFAGGAVVLGGLASIWRPLLADSVSFDLAKTAGLRPKRARLIFMLLMAGVIAMTMKIVGILLITALLILPAAAARRFAGTPEMMVLGAVLAGLISVLAGLGASLQYDTPSGPSIIVAALILFLASLSPLATIVIKTVKRPAGKKP